MSCSDCSNPIAFPEETRTYTVTVTDTNGCISIAQVLLTVEQQYIAYLPNIFSPNEDGENDAFLVRGTGIEKLQLLVFDRWGERVYDSGEQTWTGDGTIGWNGKLRNEALNPSVFVYKLTGSFVNGKDFNQKGNVTLVR